MAKIPFRALAITAHPDDMEFGFAATFAKWADQGADLTLCIVTDGSTGTQDRDLMGEPLAKLRLEEQSRSIDILGINELVWLGYPDGYVEYDLNFRKEIARVFRTYRPHRFVVMDPTPTIGDRFINHPDHRATGQASLDVSMTAGTTPGHFPELLEEGLEPWRGLREVWIAGPAGGPVAVDVSATIDRKIEALLCHQSQVGTNADMIAGWVKDRSAEAGKPHGYDFAETFQMIGQGPGFHAGEQEEVDFDFVPAPLDPRSAPAG
jgi:LmbE family N-acetylglucosaminyl deacetylase